MAYNDLGEFLRKLEAAGELKRIPFEVDPVLEMTEFADRSVKRGGPALLFEKAKGSTVPVAMNLFASARRMELALEVDSVDEVARRISDYLEMRMPEGLIGKLKMLPKLAEMGSFFPKMVSSGPVKEVVQRDGSRSWISPSCIAGRKTAGALLRCRWCFRRTRKPANATAACTACRCSTSAPPVCTGRRTSKAPSTTAAW